MTSTVTLPDTNGTTHHVNGNSSRPSRPLKPGISVPLITPFLADESVDIDTLSKHVLRMARSGLTSLVLLGSNGEAAHILPSERRQITHHARQILDSNGFEQLPLIIGCSAQSVRETISFCKDAAESGADYAIILPPCYFRPAMTDAALTDYFTAVADGSPIPFLIYNYPGAVAGVDLSSDVISTLAKHPKIVGCKLTCGNTGKLARISANTNAASASSTGSGWMCMGGSADFTLQTLIAGGSGIITGLGNVVPKTCVKLFDLYAAGKMDEAKKLQALVAGADWVVIQGGVVGTKVACDEFFGYGGEARRPLPKATAEQKKKWVEGLRRAVEYENSL